MLETNETINWIEPSKLKPKEGNFIIITFMKWSKKVKPTKVVLETLGEIDIILPPKLPHGYKMVWHNSWDNLIAKLYDSSKGYTFEELDAIKYFVCSVLITEIFKWLLSLVTLKQTL